MATKTLTEIQATAICMIKDNADLRTMQMAMDRMAHLEYQLPEPLRRLEWVRKWISSSPYEALRAATRALSNLDPRPKIEPISVIHALEKDTSPNSDMARRKANEWEKTLMWQFGLAAERQGGLLLSDILRSALQYDEICARVTHLPTQVRAYGKIAEENKRYEAAMRYGDFVIELVNPRYVSVRYSGMMPEEILYAAPVDGQEILDFWGEAASGVADLMKQQKSEDEEDEGFILFEYSSYTSYAVWAVRGSDPSNVRGTVYDKNTARDEFVEIVAPREMKHPFMNWVCRRGGTNLDAAPEHQRMPLLYPVYRAQQWVQANIIGTLEMSEAISEFGRPKYAIGGPNSRDVRLDYAEPGQRVNLPPGHDIKPMPQMGLDPALNEFFDKVGAAMDRSTVSRILVTAESQPGEAYSAYNLRINQAVGSLMPWKVLSEGFIVEVFKTMLYWTHYTGGEISGYDTDKKSKGALYVIDSEDIDPNRLYIKAELVPDVPSDRVQKTNAAVMQARELQRPIMAILEELGVADPERERDDWIQEQFLLAAMQGKVQLIQAQTSNQIQQMAAQMAQQMIAEMQKAGQQQPGGPQQPGGGPPEAQGPMGEMANPQNIMGGLGMPGIDGQGYNPAMGGMPPAGASPNGNIKEFQTGLTRQPGEEALAQ